MRRYRCHDMAGMEEAAVYRLLSSLVVPRPIALVSTLSAKGVPNLAPFSFFTVAAPEPPVLAISAGPRYGRVQKDTVTNIEASEELVVNVVDTAMAREMNQASLDLPADVDEFALTGLVPIPSRHVEPPRVAQSPAQLECRLLEICGLGKWKLILASVVAIHLADDLVGDDGRVDCRRVDAIGRLAGELYCRTGHWLAIPRDGDRPDLR